MRGQKICSACGKATGPRKKVCDCGHPFSFKPERMRQPKTDAIEWKELVAGDIIKVKQNSGPVWLTTDKEKVYLGYRGVFRVKYVDTNGIHAYPVKAPEGGHCYIYMGKKTKSVTGTYMRPHRIRKLRKKEPK